MISFNGGLVTLRITEGKIMLELDLMNGVLDGRLEESVGETDILFVPEVESLFRLFVFVLSSVAQRGRARFSANT